MLRAIIIASLALLLAACSSTPVRLRISQLDAQQTPQPLAGARVRAVMLDAGTIPLPLNNDTLAEMLTKQQTVAITDTQGIAHLALLRSRSQLIEAEGALTFTDAPIPFARWLLTPEGELRALSDNTTLYAEIIR